MSKITFRINQKHILSWISSENLLGDPIIVGMVKIYSEIIKGRFVGHPTGPKLDRDYLRNPIVTTFLLRELFDDDKVEIIEGSLQLPSVPSKAIV